MISFKHYSNKLQIAALEPYIKAKVGAAKVEAISRNGEEQKGTEIRSNRTGPVEHTFLS